MFLVCSCFRSSFDLLCIRLAWRYVVIRNILRTFFQRLLLSMSACPWYIFKKDRECEAPAIGKVRNGSERLVLRDSCVGAIKVDTMAHCIKIQARSVSWVWHIFSMFRARPRNCESWEMWRLKDFARTMGYWKVE